MKHAGAWIVTGVVIAALLLLWVASPSRADPVLEGKSAIVHKSMSCGCCGTYVSYAQTRGMTVQVINTEENTKIKEEYGVPTGLRSCHTTIIDGYFVEGPVPAEAIAKLLTERPNIRGIAIPGMPSGSPGMPSAKGEPFVVYAVNNDGTSQEYMRI